jgi:hypothetical protein
MNHAPAAATGEPVRLEYEVSAADHRRVMRALVARQPLIRSIRIASMIVPPLMIAWSMSDGWSLGAALFRNAFWIVVGGLQLLFLIPLTAGRAVEAARHTDPGWSETQTVVLDGTGIRRQSASSQTGIGWNEVDHAVERGDMLLVWFQGTRVLYVPTRATRNEAELRALRSILRANLGERAALAGPPRRGSS